ncbi:MAG: pentapeptide repeat-containing protein, partial [Crocosphaera sp.]|nr:pentapeptide repeat-containing protein [Crocosphaera sp.]
EDNPDVKIDLSDADLSGANLSGSNLSNACFIRANLSGA